MNEKEWVKEINQLRPHPHCLFIINREIVLRLIDCINGVVVSALMVSRKNRRSWLNSIWNSMNSTSFESNLNDLQFDVFKMILNELSRLLIEWQSGGPDARAIVDGVAAKPS